MFQKTVLFITIAVRTSTSTTLHSLAAEGIEKKNESNKISGMRHSVCEHTLAIVNYSGYSEISEYLLAFPEKLPIVQPLRNFSEF
jgi:hypothetical protein